MVRKPTPDNPRLEALLDERDHLRIQLSLALDNPSTPDEGSVVALRKAISNVNRRIENFSS